MYNPFSYTPWASYGLYSSPFAASGSIFDALSTSENKKSSAQRYQETQERIKRYETSAKPSAKPSSDTKSTRGDSKDTDSGRQTEKTNQPDMTAGTVGYDANTARDVEGVLSSAAKGAALGGLTNLGLGLSLGLGPDAVAMGITGAISPASVTGLASNALAASQGIPTSTTTTALGGILGTALAGPIGGLVGGFAAPFAADALADAFNARENEKIKDDLEDTYGYFGGRQIGRGFEHNLTNPMTDPVGALTGAIANKMGIDYAADITGYMSDIGLNKNTSLDTLKGMDWATGYAHSMREVDKALGLDTMSHGYGDSGIKGGFSDTGQFGGIGTDRGGWGTDVGGDIGGGMMSHGTSEKGGWSSGLSGTSSSPSRGNLGSLGGWGLGGWSAGFGDSGADDSGGSSMGSSSGGGGGDYSSDDGW